jgi:uncharacterized protein (DUF952 family)
MAFIYHITTRSAWEQGVSEGAYASPSLKDEGFIHCSEKEQVAYIRERFYKDQSSLVLLEIDTTQLESQLIFEWSPSVEQTFPHIYGPINLSAVVGVEAL